MRERKDERLRDDEREGKEEGGKMRGREDKREGR